MPAYMSNNIYRQIPRITMENAPEPDAVWLANLNYLTESVAVKKFQAPNVLVHGAKEYLDFTKR
jgi:hypothetical protein